MSKAGQDGILMTYRGGPRADKQEHFKSNPKIVACGPEAKAKGMFGIYRTESIASGVGILRWHPIARPT